jgi:hypothetical protein
MMVRFHRSLGGGDDLVFHDPIAIVGAFALTLRQETINGFDFFIAFIVHRAISSTAGGVPEWASSDGVDLSQNVWHGVECLQLRTVG